MLRDQRLLRNEFGGDQFSLSHGTHVYSLELSHTHSCSMCLDQHAISNSKTLIIDSMCQQLVCLSTQQKEYEICAIIMDCVYGSYVCFVNIGVDRSI